MQKLYRIHQHWQHYITLLPDPTSSLGMFNYIKKINLHAAKKNS